MVTAPCVLLGITYRTANTHRKTIMGKLRIHHRGQLRLYALQHGYVHVTPRGVFYPGFQRRIRQLAIARGKDAVIPAHANP